VNIIIVDDEQFALLDLKSAAEEALPGSNFSCFNTSKSALEYAKNNQVDIAFLDIEMGGMNGIQLAKRLIDITAARGFKPAVRTNIVFVTGYKQYAIDAFNLHASGYILKPVAKKAILEVVNFLRSPIGEPPAITTTAKKLRVQTFGNFEVFFDGKPLVFARTKTKELFAYLVSRQGAQSNNNEITAVLWEDKEDTPQLQRLFRQLVMDLTKTFSEAGITDVIVKERGHLAIIPDKFSCDFYDFCAGINVNNYMGEFMTQYGWAEFTNSYLDKIQKKSLI
jgi:two-component SAPR family response regulator